MDANFLTELQTDFDKVSDDGRYAANQEARISQGRAAEKVILDKFIHKLASGNLNKDTMIEASTIVRDNLRYI